MTLFGLKDEKLDMKGTAHNVDKYPAEYSQTC